MHADVLAEAAICDILKFLSIILVPWVCIVNKRIYLSMLLHDRVNKLLHIAFTGYVRAKEISAYLISKLLSFHVNINKYDLAPCLSACPAVRASEKPCAACDDYYFSFKTIHIHSYIGSIIPFFIRNSANSKSTAVSIIMPLSVGTS